MSSNEHERGCGFRKIGGVYLVGEGPTGSCDALPIALGPCEDCEFDINQARVIQSIHAGYLSSKIRTHVCRDEFSCPICAYGKPRILARNEAHRKGEEFLGPNNFFIMWVGQEYTPEEFLKEAALYGVSKRIAANSLPSKFMIGRDWIFLAHRDVGFPVFSKEKSTVIAPDGEACEGPAKVELVRKRGIFFAFKPKRLELVLYQGQIPDESMEEYEEAGYHVVLIEATEENKKRHGRANPPPPLIQRPNFAPLDDSGIWHDAEDDGEDGGE